MKQWLHDRPWVWIVLLMALLVAGSAATLIIAELNKPEVLKRSAVESATCPPAAEVDEPPAELIRGQQVPRRRHAKVDGEGCPSVQRMRRTSLMVTFSINI